MGSTLEVTSQQGQGSTFWFELPVHGDQFSPSRETLSPETSALAAVPSGEQTRLLCIDDSISNLKLVESLIKRHRPNWQFSSAQDGRSGLEQAERLLPDLILLDLQLPEVTGESVLHELRRNPMTMHIPIVMISADATSQSQERLLASGADGYITKPFELSVLTELLDRSTHRAR